MDSDSAFSLFSSAPKKSERTSSKQRKRTAVTATELEPANRRKTEKIEVPPDTTPNSVSDRFTKAQAECDSPELVPQQNVETSTFKGLGVSEWLQTVCRGLGMTKPTQVQEGCIPAILAGKDVIGTAQTGSGKTAAFALPILQKLSREPYGVFALVLTPTRELAFQLADQFRALGSGMSLKEQVVVGGLEIQQQCKALTRRPHVVIATPGRLKALIDHDPDIKAAFRRTAFLVLDEADRLLEPSFEEELSTILRAVPTKRQTLLFSATMTKSLTVLAEQLMKDAYRFAAYEGLRTAERLQQDYVFVPAKVKEVYLAHLLGSLEGLKIRSAIIFTATRSKCQLLQEILNELEIGAVSLHSGKPQSARLSALDAFRSRLAPILIATDVASRGLDIPTVDLVVNFDLPTLARDYVHRVGRTARAGRRGWCVSFVTQFDVELVHRVEALIGSQLTKYEMDEAEVLKGITKVYTAKRTAAMRLAEQREDAENRRRTRAK